MKTYNEMSIDVKIMQTLAEFNYLVNDGETISIDEIKLRARFTPSIVDEPDLQALVHTANDSTIKSVTRNSMGLWYNFK